MANQNRSQLSTSSSTLFPDNTSQLISPLDLRTWITSGIDSFVTQKDVSTFENAFYEAKSSSIVAAATTNLALATGNFIHITNSPSPNTITYFGTCPAGTRFILCFDTPTTITASAYIIIPGITSGNDKITVAGDCCMIISEGAGVWRIVGYFPAAGAGAGTVTSVSGTGSVNGITLTGTVTTTGSLTLGGSLSGVDLTSQVTGVLPVANGGSGTSTPSLVAGTNVTISGSWPNQTINATGGGGGSGTVTSVDLTMPSAFAVSGNPITTSGTLAVTGAGLASQYVRGDGTLANFPELTGGGSSISYYLNGSVTQLTIGGTTYYQMSKTPILGSGTNFTRTSASGDGYVASFITDAADPNIISIPGGNFNIEFYFSASSGGGSPQFYAELYKYDGAALTLIASGSTNPEGITNGTTVDQYFTSISVPTTALALTDRIAVRVYVITSGRNITLHTEDNNLCQVITTISTGLTALNGLTAQVQTFATGTSGTDFAISSVTNTHTFNLPDASATARGLITTGSQTLAGIKTFGNGTSPGEIRLLEGSAGGSDSIGIKSPLTVGSGGYDLTLPSSTGTSGQVLQTDGTGVLSWVNNGQSLLSKYISFTTPTVYAANTALGVFVSVLIPANTFSSGSVFKVIHRATKTGGGNSALRLGFNTTNSIVTGSIQYITASTTVTGQPGTIARHVSIYTTGGTTTTSFFNSGLAAYASANSNDIQGNTVTSTNTSIDWSVDQYCIITASTAVTDSFTNVFLSVSPA
jgi:hypothetical protein